MTPTRSPKFLRGSCLVINLLVTATLGSGCGTDGAGTIHIDSSKARKQMMRTGAGPTPTATAKPSASGTPQESVPHYAIKSHTQKKS